VAQELRAERVLQFSPTGDHIAVVYGALQVNIWDVGSGSGGPIIALERESYVSELSPDGRMLVLSDQGYGRTSIWDAVTGRPIELEAANEVFDHVAFSSDGRMIATVRQSTVQIWDVRRHRRLSSMVHPEDVQCVVFDPTGIYLATGSQQTSKGAASQDRKTWRY